MTPLSVWTDEELIDFLIEFFYRNSKRLKRIFNGEEPLEHQSLVYYYLGECHFMIGRLEEFGYNVERVRKVFGELLELFASFYDRNKRAFADNTVPDLRGIFRGHASAIISFKQALAKGEDLNEGYAAEEFDAEVLSYRDWFEYALMGMRIAGHDYPTDELRRLYDGFEETLRQIVPAAIVQFSREEWIVQRPDMYPEEFWWHKLAWEAVKKDRNQ